MIQCPACSHRTFTVTASIDAFLTITGNDQGGHTEVACDRVSEVWHNLQCDHCGHETDEETARQAFEAATP